MRRTWTALGGLVAVLLVGPRARGEDATLPEIVPADDTVIETSVRVRPGEYFVRDENGDGILRIVRDGVTVDMTGVTLLGGRNFSRQGVGVSVVGARGVTLRGGAVVQFRVNVRAERAPDLHLVGVDAGESLQMHLKSTPAREDPSDWLWPHENDEGQWETRYGAGISLTDCAGARVERCRANRAQNGLLLSRCPGARVEANDFSWNSGWGIALWRTSGAVVEENRCDWCVRGYSHGVYARGQDSAGILVFEQCSDNRFARNSATHSGDGFFLYAGHETTRRTGEGGCNRNVLWRNDFSHAVANGIEATFSVGNQFLENRLDDCEHGIWAGYSSETTIRGNRIVGCANGVSIEHGQRNVIEGNRIEGARRGVHLWWDEDEDLLSSAFGRRRPTASERNRIAGNLFAQCEEPIRLEGDRGTTVARNRVVAREVDPVDPLWRTSPPYLDPSVRRGRAEILVGEWGPVDRRLAGLFPETQTAAGAAHVRVFGPDGARYEVRETSPGVVVDAPKGAAGDGFTVRAEADDPPSILAFRVIVEIGDREFVATGTLMHTTWKVAWWPWSVDPRADAAAWTRLLAGPPAATAQRTSLDLAGGGSPAEGVPADRFATLATTTLRVPAGRYRFRIVSDDGVRATVDGRPLFEDWTWHGPKEDVVETDLSEGAHEVRVEHFEIDGYAALRLSVEPVTDHH